ncbi:formyltransferase family protein [Candidatus Neomarinimicrobiota bacterium]
MEDRKEMAVKSLILLGDIPLATKCLRMCLQSPLVKVVGVICMQESRRFKNDPWDEPCVYDYAHEQNLRIMTVEYVEEGFDESELDIGFSCRASHILKPRFLSRFKKSVVNMHGGILPEMRGVHLACHSIIEGWEEGGGTLHYMDEGIDTGPIIAERRFPIQRTDTAFSVYQKTQHALWTIFRENFDSILNDEERIISQQHLVDQGRKAQYFNMKALGKRKEINIQDMSLEEIDRHVRGCDFPGHEPAFFIYDGKKYYVTTLPFFQSEKSMD